jgi:predicted dehydrogenase
MAGTGPTRLGVVGCGFIGALHVEAARSSELLDVVAVADVRAEVAQAVADRFGVPARYDDARALIADDDVEAVVLAIPAAGRAELAVVALRVGKHLLLEKPPAMKCAELELIARARVGDLVVACCSSRFRHFRAARAAADFLRSGALGRIRVVRSLGTRPVPPTPPAPAPAWRLNRALNGGGVLANWGSYDLDHALGVTAWELEPSTVFSTMYGIPPELTGHVAEGSDAETHAVVVVACRGGESVVLQRSEYVASSEEDEICVVGDRGSLRWSLRPAAKKSVVHESFDPVRGVERAVVWSGADAFDIHDMQRAVLEDFAQAVRGERAPATDLTHAFVIQSVLDAAYASARTEQAVAVAELAGFGT